MNRFFTVLLPCLLIAIPTRASAQLFEENFSYPAGDSLTQHGYLISSGGTTNAILTVAPGLTYSGYASSGVGNAARIDTTGQDVYKTFPSVSAGNAYLAFMMNVAKAKTGDYFIALSPTAGQTNYYARVHLRDSLGLGYRIGISKYNEVSGGAAYGTRRLLYSTTYLLVVKYTFNPGSTTDDAVSVYVLGPSVPPSTEPSVPEVGPYTSASTTDAVNLGFVTLRQGSASASPRLTIDGIRIGQTWDGVVRNLPVSLFSKKSIAFGSVNVSATKTDTVTTYNLGASALNISGVTSTDPAFSVLPARDTIAPLDSAKFVVSFAPTASKSYSSTIVFLSNTARGLDTITATGTGVQVPPNPNFALLSPANGSSITLFTNLTYDFKWNKATDLNNDTLVYEVRPIGAPSGISSNNSGRDTIATIGGPTLLGYLTGDSLVMRWTVLAKDPTNPAVGSKDTFAVTLRRGVLTPGWSSNVSNTTENLWCVKTINQGVAWVGGDKGVVLRTVNAGKTWTNVGGGAMGAQPVWEIDAVDANNAFVSTSPTGFTYIFRTTNGGAHWDTVFALAGGFINGIHMYDATNGIALGDPVGGKWVVLKTSNGGGTWSRIATEPSQVGSEAGWVNSFAYFGSKVLSFGTNSGRIYRTNNAGATWSSAPIPLGYAFAVGFIDSTYGVALLRNPAGTAIALARTSNGGGTWDTVSAPGSGSISAVAAPAGKFDFWIGREREIYRSTNRGATWSLEWNLGSVATHASFVTYGNSSSGWVVGYGGAIAGDYVTSLTGINDRGSVIPEAFALEQNFPNPFNPSTTIRYALPATSRVTLKIYNILGQFVARLRDQVQSAGSYDVVWDGSNSQGAKVSSGVYFYHLEATPANDGQTFITSKKMIMLK